MNFESFKVPIQDFRIRGNYPNKRNLNFNAQNRIKGSKKASRERSGYHPPIVEYQYSNNPTETYKLIIRDIDLPFLWNTKKEDGCQYLQMILNARDGDKKSRGALKEIFNKYFKDKTLSKAPKDTNKIVTSFTDNNYYNTLISHKGKILLKLSQLGYPVPDFVILTTDTYKEWEFEKKKLLTEAIKNLETLTDAKLGHKDNPLIFALRCAMPMYIPGLMPTYLNVGITFNVLPGLQREYGKEVGNRIFLNTLKNIIMILDDDYYQSVRNLYQKARKKEEINYLTKKLINIIEQKDPKILHDAFYQAEFFINQAYQDYEENSDILSTFSRGEKHYPSIILQKMVCTVRSLTSFAGVLYSRNSQTGIGMELETGHNIFGEEIMTGDVETETTTFSNREEIEGSFPSVHHFAKDLKSLEKEFETPVTIEFASESQEKHNLFALLQLNDSEMTGRSAFISIVNMHKEGMISRKKVTDLIHPYHIKQMESDAIDRSSLKSLKEFSSGISILPRHAVSAKIYFSAKSALQAKKRGEQVCLCKKNFEPADTIVMREMDAILSLTSAAIHVVTICRSFGVPALLNLEEEGVKFLSDFKLTNSNGDELSEGDWITISSKMRLIFTGKASYKPAKLFRYMNNEDMNFSENEQNSFAEMAYAYRYYFQLIRGLKMDQITTLNELVRLVNLEMRRQVDDARKLVRAWFDTHESLYVNELLKSDLGDHLNQNTVFDMLTLEQKIRFYKRVLAICYKEKRMGLTAGSFMLGRFISQPQSVAFWKAFTPLECGLLINEWILFEKYMHILHEVGAKHVLKAKNKILRDGLYELDLKPRKIKGLISLKLSDQNCMEIMKSIPNWCDKQTASILQILNGPYSDFYDFDARWSIKDLEGICQTENIPIPCPSDC